MKMIPIQSSNDLIDANSVEPKKLSGFTRGVLIGVLIVCAMWFVVIVLAVLLFH
jgi:hypothetical protein